MNNSTRTTLMMIMALGALTMGCDDSKDCVTQAGPESLQTGGFGPAGGAQQAANTPSRLPANNGQFGVVTGGLVQGQGQAPGVLSGLGGCAEGNEARGGFGAQGAGGGAQQKSCQQLGWYGECDGDSLYYCNGQEVVHEDCKSHGGTCGFIEGNEDDGMNCIIEGDDQGSDSGYAEADESYSGDDDLFYGDNSFESWGMDY